MTTPLAFLTSLYAGVTAQGWVEFRYLKGGAKHWMPWPAFPEHPDLFTPDRAPAGKDVYFGVALRKDQTSGKAENCKPTRLVWVDVDLADHPDLTGGLHKDTLHQTAPEELAEYKAVLLAQSINTLADHGLSIRAAVDSGHGVQLYLAREYATDQADTERFNRALAHLLGGDLKSTDLARILRVPGTHNLKNPARPLPVQVLFTDEAATVTDAALNALPQPEKAAPEPTERRDAPAPLPQTGATNYERYAQNGLAREVEALRATQKGDRNHALNKATFNAATLVGAGVLDEVQAAQELTEAALSIGLEPAEIQTTIRSAMTAGKAKPRDLSKVGVWQPNERARGTIGKPAGRGDLSSAVADALPEKPTLDQLRNLVLTSFTERGMIFRYHQIWRSWWHYEGGVYSEVPDEVMAQTVDLTLQAFGHTLKNAQVSEVLVKIGRDAGIGSRDVDQSPWELNTKTGILNLEDGELYEHTPEYFSIIQSAARYEPGSVAHDWLAFLRQAVPSETDRALLQQFAGLCLTGDTSPQRALILIGDGGTGKSTFTKVLTAVLGDLATSSALENIKDGSFLIGTLVGKRMCTVSELQQGKGADWLPFKRITGEDNISVDVKNKTPFKTKLDIKLVILSNVMPKFGEDTSNASLMRRFLPVEFNVKPEVPDPTLEARLTHPDELPGVLNWMIEGLHLLRRNHMRFPAADRSALAREMVENNNKVIGFLRDECRYTLDVTVTSGELYAAYRKWCGENGYYVLPQNVFSQHLAAAGKYFGKTIDRYRNTQSRGYVNLTLSTAPGGWEDES
ncbi:DNA primase family protein [Deinococcus sp. PEB2-63]